MEHLPLHGAERKHFESASIFRREKLDFRSIHLFSTILVPVLIISIRTLGCEKWGGDNPEKFQELSETEECLLIVEF